MRSSARATAPVIEAVARAAKRAEIGPHNAVLMALSGGPDSVALTHALKDLRGRVGFRLYAAHLNHRVRGMEADRDEAFVRQLCALLEIELIVERAAELKSTVSNFEERARATRREFLNRAADRVEADLVALAHQADDQAETVLMRFLRGSGAAGLAAMAEHGPGRYWRPLLAVGRGEIVNYLRAIKADWVEDSSNRSAAFLRNRIRRELLPRLESHSPGVARRLGELADEMRSTSAFIRELARHELSKRTTADGRLRLSAFDQLPVPVATNLLRAFLHAHMGHLRRVSRDHVAAMLRLCTSAEPSGRVMLPNGLQFQREYLEALIEPVGHTSALEPFHVFLDLSGTTYVEPSSFAFKTDERGPEPGSIGFEKTLTEAWFDLDCLPAPLVVRSFRLGDRIAPMGMEGTRKVKNVFIDHKLVQGRRGTWPLVVAGDKVVWIPGMVRSRIALISPSSRRICRVRALPLSSAARLLESKIGW